MATPKTTRKVSDIIRAYYEVAIDFASTAAEATSTAVTGILPKPFTIDRPIWFAMKPGETAIPANGILNPPSFTLVSGRVNFSVTFSNNNAAAGAAIDPASAVYCFLQL